jgi:hypothetical protein
MTRPGRRGTEILEQGEILFFYRPRVEEENPSGLRDVQRFYVVLRPDGGGKLRLLVLGRKRLPEVQAHERVWGFVDAVTGDAGAIERSLRAETRETKTRGERHQPAARPAGAGVYVVSLERGRMHLSMGSGYPKGRRKFNGRSILPQRRASRCRSKTRRRGSREALAWRPPRRRTSPTRCSESSVEGVLPRRTSGCWM